MQDNPNVAAKLGAYSPVLGQRLRALRSFIIDIAETSKEIGQFEESLKWGQISFATRNPKTGAPIRIDGDSEVGTYSIYVPCSTSIIEDFRNIHPDMFLYHGNREIRLDLTKPLPEAALTIFIKSALCFYI